MNIGRGWQTRSIIYTSGTFHPARKSRYSTKRGSYRSNIIIIIIIVLQPSRPSFRGWIEPPRRSAYSSRWLMHGDDYIISCITHTYIYAFTYNLPARETLARGRLSSAKSLVVALLRRCPSLSLHSHYGFVVTCLSRSSLNEFRLRGPLRIVTVQ